MSDGRRFDPATALRTVSRAHQFLAMPCEAEQLQATLQRLEAFIVATEPRLRRALGAIVALPSPTQAELAAVLADRNSSLAQATRLIEADVALASKLLQVVSTSFFGRMRRASSVAQAVAFLGGKLLEDVLVRAATPFDPGPVDANRLNRHGRAVARLAGAFAAGPAERDVDGTAGLLHDVGLLAAAAAADVPAAAREHAHVGAQLLTLWGHDGALADAARLHDAEADGAPVVRAVRLADRLVCATERGDVPSNVADADRALLARVDDWRRVVGEGEGECA